MSRSIARFFHFSSEIEFNALRFFNYTIPRLCSTYAVATITTSLDHLSIRNLLIHIDLRAILGLCSPQDLERLFWKRCQILNSTRSFLDCIVLNQEVQHQRLMPVFPIDCSSATEDGVQKMRRMVILRMILKPYCQYHQH